MANESQKSNEKQGPKKLSIGGNGDFDPDNEQSDVVDEGEDSSSDSNDS